MSWSQSSGRLAQNKLEIELTKIEEALTHPKEAWLRSHFDFAGKENGKTVLVECKNYNAGVRSKFDAETGVIPPADMAQLVHEATVFGVEKVYLAVLFGGQEFFIAPFHIHDEQKNELIRTMAEVWARVMTKQPLPPEDTDQVKLMYPVSEESVKMASASVEEAVRTLALIKREIKALEDVRPVPDPCMRLYAGQRHPSHHRGQCPRYMEISQAKQKV